MLKNVKLCLQEYVYKDRIIRGVFGSLYWRKVKSKQTCGKYEILLPA